MNTILFFKFYLLPSSSSCTDEPEELTRHRKPLSNDQDQQTFPAQRAQSSSQQPYLDDLDFAPEKEGAVLSYIGSYVFL